MIYTFYKIISYNVHLTRYTIKYMIFSDTVYKIAYNVYEISHIIYKISYKVQEIWNKYKYGVPYESCSMSIFVFFKRYINGRLYFLQT